MRWIVLVALLPLFVGCTGASGTDSPGQSARTAEERTSPFEMLRSGMIQLGQAQSAIADAYEAAAELGASEAVEDIRASIDSAGDSISAFAVEPPSEQQYNYDPEWPPKLDEALKAAGDSRLDLLDAKGAAESFAEEASGEQKVKLDRLIALIDEAIDSLASAIEGMGGRIEEPEA